MRDTGYTLSPTGSLGNSGTQVIWVLLALLL